MIEDVSESNGGGVGECRDQRLVDTRHAFGPRWATADHEQTQQDTHEPRTQDDRHDDALHAVKDPDQHIDDSHFEAADGVPRADDEVDDVAIPDGDSDRQHDDQTDDDASFARVQIRIVGLQGFSPASCERSVGGRSAHL